MRLTSMQFDGDGGYDAPLNSGTTASVGSDKDYKDSAGETVTPAAPVEAASETNTRNNAKAETATRMAGMGSPSALAAQESGQIGGTSMATRMKAMGASAPSASTGVAKSEKAKAPIDKSKWDRGIKVSQSTVDAVKDAGRGNMGKVPSTKVRDGAPGYNGSTFDQKAPVSAEYKEAVKRIYPNASPADKPKVYGGAAAEKYKAEKNKAALPPILPTPKATQSGSTPQQRAQGEARAGGNIKLKPVAPYTPKVETAAEKAAAKKRQAAAAEARAKGNGRSQ